jgi:site-specific recombinase XerD
VVKTVRLPLARAAARYLTDLEVADRSPSTLRWYRQKLDQLQRAVPVDALEDLGREHLMEFIADLRRQGRSSAYVRGWYQVFRSFIGWCRTEKYEIHPSLVADDPSRWFALRKPASTDPGFLVYSDDDLDHILDVTLTAQSRIFIRVLVGTGIRLSEALGLEIDDVEEDRIRIRSGKGRKPRSVPLNTKLARDLHRYVERVRPDAKSDYLFLGREGGPWTEWGVRSMFARLSRRAKLRVYAHAFRHTFATNYLRSGGEIHRLQRILGHSTITMSLRYAHLTGADLSRDIDLLSR